MLVKLSTLNNISTHLTILANKEEHIVIDIDIDEQDLEFKLDDGVSGLLDYVYISFSKDISNYKANQILPLLDKNLYINYDYVKNRNLPIHRLKEK